MKMKRAINKLAHYALLMVLFWSGIVMASPPADITGYWSVAVGQEQEDMEIIRQDSYPSGACQKISGKFRGIAPFHGIYCPASGRVQMVHENLSTSYAVRVFTGNLAEEIPGYPNRMAGTFTVLYPTFGEYGEYGFSATQ
jgi:hypothetical protein